jgi:hypothetical protein
MAGLITIDRRTRFDIEFIELHAMLVIAKAASKQTKRVVEVLEHCITILLCLSLQLAETLLVKIESIDCKVIVAEGHLDAAPRLRL